MGQWMLHRALKQKSKKKGEKKRTIEERWPM